MQTLCLNTIFSHTVLKISFTCAAYACTIEVWCDCCLAFPTLVHYAVHGFERRLTLSNKKWYILFLRNYSSCVNNKYLFHTLCPVLHSVFSMHNRGTTNNINFRGGWRICLDSRDTGFASGVEKSWFVPLGIREVVQHQAGQERSPDSTCQAVRTAAQRSCWDGLQLSDLSENIQVLVQGSVCFRTNLSCLWQSKPETWCIKVVL